MKAKIQFLSSSKTLVEWWTSVSIDPRFDLVLLHAGNIALESCPSAEQREGVLFLKETLLTMSQTDIPTPDFPGPGMNHNLDTKRKTIESTTP